MSETTLRPAARRPPGGDEIVSEAVLPNLVVIGAMKCGTTALHEALGRHPHVSMSVPKELNFFFGPPAPQGARDAAELSWAQGNWHRGTRWYARHFDPSAPVRGESSPGYTSPAHEEAAARMAALIPGARLVYLVRDPIARAVSQFRHHRGEGSETRALQTALTDPSSQYLARSRYHERLGPFLESFAPDRLAIVAQEELLVRPRTTLDRLLRFVGVDEGLLRHEEGRPRHLPPRPALEHRLRRTLEEALRDDADRLRALADRDFPGWSL
jgi:hypothetical protein